jgi:two-component system KDP operon response regulator KdpE
MINKYKTRLGDVAVDYTAMRVWFEGNEVKLTKTEFKILRELTVNNGKVISYTTLLEGIWGQAYNDEKSYVHEYIRRLRLKLEPYHQLESCIQNVPGVGYRFDCTQ